MSQNFYPSVEFRHIELASRADIEKLCQWSVESKEMIPLDPYQIASYQFGTAAYVFGEIAGYAAIKVMYSKHVIELGGLVVNPRLRRLQVGSSIVREVKGQASDALNPDMILAFANEKSQPLFEKMGGEIVEDVSALPPEVWKQCYMCPRFQEACAIGKQCCDRVLDITNI